MSSPTPLIGLASIRRFDLLRRLFGEIRIAQGVHDEVFAVGHGADNAKYELKEAEWIHTVTVGDRLAVEWLHMRTITARSLNAWLSPDDAHPLTC